MDQGPRIWKTRPLPNHFFEGQWPKTSDVGLKLISNPKILIDLIGFNAQKPTHLLDHHWHRTAATAIYLTPRCQTTPDLRHVLRCQWCQYICWPPPGLIFSRSQDSKDSKVSSTVPGATNLRLFHVT